MPNNDMGKEENITNRTFEAAASAMSLSIEESRRNALELLKKVLVTKDESNEKNWKPE